MTFSSNHALIALLVNDTAEQPWWRGYFDTECDPVIVADAPRVELYAGWPDVLISAAPHDALRWVREVCGGSRTLPDLMFPADRGWLVSRLWDDA